MDLGDVLAGVGAFLVVAVLAVAIAIDSDTILPGDPTKEEWRRH